MGLRLDLRVEAGVEALQVVKYRRIVNKHSKARIAFILLH